MKKYLGIALVLLALASFPVYAAATTQTTITAVVPSALTVTAELPATAPIDVNNTSTTLGTVGVFSNVDAAWKVTVTSTNGGFMKGAVNTTSHYPYKITLSQQGGSTLLTAVSLATPQEATVTAKGLVKFDLVANYDKFTDVTPVLPADTYTDVVTITVATN